MLNVAVLGAGFMGATHARALAKLPDVQLVGVSSRSQDKAASLADEIATQAYTDSEALMLDPQVEAVSITLPTNLHAEYAIAALNAGKHVFVEKPMALSVAECDAMIEAAQKANRILMVAQVLRFWPEYVALADVDPKRRTGEAVDSPCRASMYAASLGRMVQSSRVERRRGARFAYP